MYLPWSSSRVICHNVPYRNQANKTHKSVYHLSRLLVRTGQLDINKTSCGARSVTYINGSERASKVFYNGGSTRLIGLYSNSFVSAEVKIISIRVIDYNNAYLGEQKYLGSVGGREMCLQQCQRQPAQILDVSP